MPQVLNYFSDSWLIYWQLAFLLTYLFHIAEEYWGGGGYSAYLLKSHFVEMSPARFLALQSLGMFLMFAGVAISMPLSFPITMLTIIAAIVLANALVHGARSLSGRTYTPGLITAILLWLPLGAGWLFSAWNVMPGGRFLFAVMIGVSISLLVEIIAMRGGRLLKHF